MERYAGRFGLLKRLGKGGMGEVFLAVDLSNGAEFALKRLTRRPDGPSSSDLQREFQALARVRHPVIVRVFELGFDFDNEPFLVMEYIPGWSADEVIRPGDWSALYFVAARVAAGLEALHAAGIVHGDLKPSNLLVVPSAGGGRPRDLRIVDFGLAAFDQADAAGHRGTAGFTAPEVVRGEVPTPAADLYALGTTLYAIAAGRAPFEGADVAAILRRQQAGPPSSLALEEAGVPDGLTRLILHLTAPAPIERPRTAADVRRSFEALSPAARSPLAERLQSERLIGRVAELSRLDREWRRSLKSARAVFLRGEAGVGKSALLGELATRGQLEGRSVIRLTAAASPEPGAGLRQLLRRLAADARVEIANSLAPPLREALESPGAEDEEAALAAALDRAFEWCRSIAARGAPVAVLLDDSEELDPASRRAIRRLMLAGEAAPALWVLARRLSGETQPEDERLLLAAGAAVEIRLGALTRADVASLIAARIQVEPPESLVDLAWDRAAGHPGLTVEWLRSAATSGALIEDELGVRVDADRIERVPLASDFEASRLGRLSELGPGVRRAADLLAICRRPRPIEYLRRIDDSIAGRDLDRLSAEGLAVRDLGDDWALTPPALASVIAERIPEEKRRATHRAILDAGDLGALEEYRHRLGVGDEAGAIAAAERAFREGADPALASEVADRLEPADPIAAARWFDRSARELMDRGRYAAALPIVERALKLDADSPARPNRWAWLTTCLLRVGDLAGLERACAQAKREQLTDAATAVLLTNESALRNMLGDSRIALQLAESAVECATKSESDIALGNAWMTKVAILQVMNRLDEALASLPHAELAFEKARYSLGQIRAQGQRCGVLASLGRLDEAERVNGAAVRRARSEHVRAALDELLTQEHVLLARRGSWEAARSAQAECVRLAMEDARAQIAALGITNLAIVDGQMGEVRRGRSETRVGLRLAIQREPRILPMAQRARALVLRASGDLSGADRWASRALSLARSRASEFDVLWATIERARIAASRGQWRNALKFARSLPGIDTKLDLVGATVLRALSGRALLRAGATDDAKRTLAELGQMIANSELAYASAVVEQLRAEIQLVGGDFRSGTQTADRVLDAFKVLPATPDRAECALDFAKLASGIQGFDEASSLRWLELAEESFERLGNYRGRGKALLLHVEVLKRSRPVEGLPVREHDLIEEVSKLLDSMSDFDELIRRAMRLAVRQLDAECGVLLLVDPESGRLEARAEYGAVDPEKRREATTYSRRAVERAAESGTAILIHDAPADPRARSDSVMSLRLRSILCVPMYRGGRVIGVVYLDDSRQTNTFEESDRALMEGFAQLMAIAIDNSRGQEEVRRTNEQLVGENLSLRQELEARFRPSGIIGTSAAIVKLLSVVERAAQGSSTVLLTGENGTGKELIARVLHHSGKRRLGPFVAVNCGAIPETLIESELFGHEKGAFTDAHQSRKGRFEQAEGGTLFLDEIGEMPLSQQVRLLLAISNREVTPVGGSKPVPVDVRIIAATNQDLRRRISEGLFREDLFYRLNVIPIEVPPLRDRKADIPAIARHFVEYFSRLQERDTPEMAPEFLAALMQSDWPGNVRELQNYIERVMALTPGKTLHPHPLPRDLEERGAGTRLSRRRRLADQVAEMERRAILDALERAGGNQSHAARELGMTEQALRYRLKKYGHTGHRQYQRVRRIQRRPRI